MPQEETEPRGNEQRKAVIGGLLGISVISLFQFLTLPVLNKRLTVAIYCFAISIPLLALYLRALIAEAQYGHHVLVWYVALSGLLGMILWFVGLAAVFFHFSIGAGVLFSLFAILSLICSTRYRVRLSKR